MSCLRPWDGSYVNRKDSFFFPLTRLGSYFCGLFHLYIYESISSSTLILSLVRMHIKLWTQNKKNAGQVQAHVISSHLRAHYPEWRSNCPKTPWFQNSSSWKWLKDERIGEATWREAGGFGLLVEARGYHYYYVSVEIQHQWMWWRAGHPSPWK